VDLVKPEPVSPPPALEPRSPKREPEDLVEHQELQEHQEHQDHQEHQGPSYFQLQPGVPPEPPDPWLLLLPRKVEVEAEASSDRPALHLAGFQAKKKSGGSPRRKEAVKASEKQSFKCQKCGKCYNWNYNLNRHMRFECGIENRFECSNCHKRFPYKQNAAIHLKRKHKLAIDSADDMIAGGHITLLPAATCSSGPG
jgi:hypothetical protein